MPSHIIAASAGDRFDGTSLFFKRSTTVERTMWALRLTRMADLGVGTSQRFTVHASAGTEETGLREYERMPCRLTGSPYLRLRRLQSPER